MGKMEIISLELTLQEARYLMVALVGVMHECNVRTRGAVTALPAYRIYELLRQTLGEGRTYCDITSSVAPWEWGNLSQKEREAIVFSPSGAGGG